MTKMFWKCCKRNIEWQELYKFGDLLSIFYLYLSCFFQRFNFPLEQIYIAFRVMLGSISIFPNLVNFNCSRTLPQT